MFLVILEKIDFVKDIYVAAFVPHASRTNAFMFWVSINVPTFWIFLYFYWIERMDQFLPTFFGFTELWNDKDDQEQDDKKSAK